jgi:hypothetical protein
MNSQLQVHAEWPKCGDVTELRGGGDWSTQHCHGVIESSRLLSGDPAYAAESRAALPIAM